MANKETQYQSVSLKEVLNEYQNSDASNVKKSTIYIAREHSPLSPITQYTAIIDQQLGPIEMGQLLEAVSPIKRAFYQEEQNLRNTSWYKDVFDAARPQPVPKGFYVFSMQEINYHRQQLLRILKAEKNVPQDVLHKPLGTIYPLEEAKEQFLNQGVKNPSVFRRILIENSPDETFIRLLDICNLNPVYEFPTREEMDKFPERAPQLLRTNQKKKIIQKFFSTHTESPTRLIDRFIRSLPEEEIQSLAQEYAIIYEYGYVTKNSEDTLVINTGTTNNAVAPESFSLSIPIGNLVVDTFLKPSHTQKGTAYDLWGKSAKIKEFVLPALRWETRDYPDKNAKDRRWDLGFFSSLHNSSIHPEIQNKYQEELQQDIQKINPLTGLITLFSTDQNLRKNWGKSLHLRSMPFQPLTPSMVPVQVAARQKDGLQHSLLRNLENRLK